MVSTSESTSNRSPAGTADAEGTEATRTPRRQSAPRNRERSPADLAAEYLGVADAVASRFRCRGSDVEDLRQVARLALVKAAQRYRDDVGHGFVPYAVPTIQGELKRYLRDHSWMVRPPRPVLELRLRVRAVTPRLQQSLQREPTVAELSRELGVSRADIAEAKAADWALFPPTIECSDEDQDPVLGRQPMAVPACEESGFDRVEALQALATALKDTSEEDRELLRLRFGMELTQAEIARRLGTNQMHVSRCLGRLLRRLRQRIAA